MANSPMEIFFDEDLTKRNADAESKEERKMKMRDYMSIAPKAWADLAEDDQMPFIEKYKELCNDAGVEPKQTAEVTISDPPAKKSHSSSETLPPSHPCCVHPPVGQEGREGEEEGRQEGEEGGGQGEFRTQHGR